MKKLLYSIPFVVAFALAIIIAKLEGQQISRPVTISSIPQANDTTTTNFTQIIEFSTNVTFQQAIFNGFVQMLSNISVGGKATFTNNVFINQLSYATNLASTNVLVLNGTEQFVKATHNISYSGFSIPADMGVSNVAWATVMITNNSASATIQAFFPGCIGDTNNFITNQASFTVKYNILYGTNVAFNSLK